MDNREISEKINRFVETVIPEYNPEKIVLYGSYAKGTNNENSDIDIAIIVDEIKGSFFRKRSTTL